MVSVTHLYAEGTSKDYLDANEWIESLADQWPASGIEQITKAWQFIEQHYPPSSGGSEPSSLQRAIGVANILAELRLDPDTLTATLLHEAARGKTMLPLEQIQEQFGKAIADLVSAISKMDAISLLTLEQVQPGEHTESLRKMLLAMAEDIRVVLVKLAKRLYHMRHLALYLDKQEQQQHFAQQTMDIFAPLANRLGLGHIKWELEDLCFRYINAKTYKETACLLAEKRIDREKYISDFMETLRCELDKEGLSADITGRPKHIYSIWKKMQKKHKSFDELFDIRAVRILVDTLPQCYTALGIVHSLWQYIPGEFDDYIATPKANNYRSIHTAVAASQGKIVEIQIRTKAMHEEAELGIAAHWKYKEGEQGGGNLDEKIAWLRQLLEWREDVAEADDLSDYFRNEAISDRIYVLTPKGQVVDLSYGATPLDFAYHIHTEVGHRCRGAKINGRIVPLTYTLQSGDRVEILTVKEGEPSRDWLSPHSGYLKTTRARNKVRNWFNLQDSDEHIAAGRSHLEKELQKLNLSEVSFEKLAQSLDYRDADDLLLHLGRGEIKAVQLTQALQKVTGIYPQDEASDVITPRKRSSKKGGKPNSVNIQGVGNLLTNFALCCKPVFGDPIIGFITQGRGITIHRQNCANVMQNEKNAARWIEVEWGDDQQQNFTVSIAVTAIDRHGLFRDISGVFSNEKIGVLEVNSRTDKKEHTAHVQFTVEIPNLELLSRVLTLIAQLPSVLEVKRL